MGLLDFIKRAIKPIVKTAESVGKFVIRDVPSLLRSSAPKLLPMLKTIRQVNKFVADNLPDVPFIKTITNIVEKAGGSAQDVLESVNQKEPFDKILKKVIQRIDNSTLNKIEKQVVKNKTIQDLNKKRKVITENVQKIKKEIDKNPQIKSKVDRIKEQLTA